MERYETHGHTNQIKISQVNTHENMNENVHFLPKHDTTSHKKPNQKNARKLFNQKDQSYLESLLETTDYDIDRVEAKILNISQKVEELETSAPQKRKRRAQKERKVMKPETSDSDSGIPETFITSAVVHASQTGEPCPVRKVATRQCLQMKIFVGDFDMIQVDNSTQPNGITLKNPVNLATSLTTLNKVKKEKESIKSEFTKFRNVPKRKKVKEERTFEDKDLIGSENEEHVLGKTEEAIKLKKKIENRPISEITNKSKRYPLKRSVKPKKQETKMNTTRAKTTNRTTHDDSNEDQKKNQEHRLGFADVIKKYDADLSRTGDYPKTDMVLRSQQSYCESIDSDVPLAKNRKRKTPHPLKAKDPLLQTNKRKKLEKVVPSKSVTNKKTETSPLPELYIEKAKKQDDYILDYKSSSGDHVVPPRYQQQVNTINEIMNEDQGRNIKSEMVQTCTDNSENNTNDFKLLPCSVKLLKLQSPANNSGSNSIFDNETVEGLVHGESECAQNCNKTNTLTYSKDKIKILQNILLRAAQHSSEASSQANVKLSSYNKVDIPTQLTPPPIASWICTGNDRPQLSQRLLEVILQFANHVTEIALEDMKGPVPPHLLAMFETFSELDATLDKFFSK